MLYETVDDVTAVSTSIDPALACGHETLLEGPQDQGARRGRPRETGGVEAVPIPGRPRVKGTALEGWLPAHLQRNPDLTLEEHREAFEEATEA